MPLSINIVPMAASRGEFNQVMMINAKQNNTKIAGIIGYPHTLYGRSASGALWRITNTPKAVAP